MSLSHEHVGSKIPAKINMFMLTRASLLIHLCYEIPCNHKPYVFWHFWQQEQKVSLNLFDQENEQTFNAKIKSNIALDRNQIEKFRSITKVALLQQKALSWSLMPVLMMEKFTGANMANKTLAASGIQRIKLLRDHSYIT